jgi:hypothetical protein
LNSARIVGDHAPDGIARQAAAFLEQQGFAQVHGRRQRDEMRIARAVTIAQRGPA